MYAYFYEDLGDGNGNRLLFQILNPSYIPRIGESFQDAKGEIYIVTMVSYNYHTLQVLVWGITKG